MDVGPLVAADYTGIIITLIILGTCWENIQLIKDVQLKVAILAFFICWIIALSVNCFTWRALGDGNIDGFLRLNIVNSTFWNIAILAQSYYSVRRTCMIYHLSTKLQNAIPVSLNIIQAVIQFTAMALWNIDFKQYYGTYASPATGKSAIATVSYIIPAEIIYFSLLQIKIAQCATAFDRNRNWSKLVALWLEAIVRVALYVVIIALSYTTASNYIPQITYWSFVMVLPAMIPVIFLTDINRFQKALKNRSNHNGPSSLESQRKPSSVGREGESVHIKATATASGTQNH
ncbi:uncharacterized protein SPPG_04105 [Spizellomyces punctatus DAOM BR117]|uniref:Uncharacterized protein n=1 Tax=Spizellomyces punctatus (strain DAOM BR117) TaxID=645134 RepID=A0A0L0HJ01_SPIPD|nr:uncharacterized protein SPPG_04105 [Spizellomyces punctatus DAOM BR117]KND01013.1 hypothetical protein SPPG_04105 [Spizellomyces punctatus DAOM BR117]|eukprot:XP_016609052.1 hypothetical protein SPPG_04105 [Spizellomyces punctatus DAOM BR117]